MESFEEGDLFHSSRFVSFFGSFGVSSSFLSLALIVSDVAFSFFVLSLSLLFSYP